MLVVVAANTVKNIEQKIHVDVTKMLAIILGCFAVLSGIVIAICVAIKRKGT